jgi:16S rRNA (uracil1498-N3)-methyltransferase
MAQERLGLAVHDFKSQRLFVEEELTKDKGFEARREQANYLLNVLRMSDGDGILIFNGRDGEWRAKVEVRGRKKCNLVPVEQMRAQPEAPSLIYCFAPLKQARLDYMIQKAVEMGCGVLQPVITQFTQARNINDKRVLSNAIEAAEQCGILAIPDIRPTLQLEKLVEHLGDEYHLIFCDEADHNANPLQQLSASKPSKIAVLIGPEGGFSDAERKILNDSPNVTNLGLGPRILRADTAGVAALAIIQAHLGDWYIN